MTRALLPAEHEDCFIREDTASVQLSLLADFRELEPFVLLDHESLAFLKETREVATPSSHDYLSLSSITHA